MATDVLRPFRDTIDAASLAERTSFARAARNAVAQAIVASALASDATANVAAPEHEPPEAEIRALLGADLGSEVAALYRGGDDWPTRAIDLLTLLDEVARAR